MMDLPSPFASLVIEREIPGRGTKIPGSDDMVKDVDELTSNTPAPLQLITTEKSMAHLRKSPLINIRVTSQSVK